MLSKTDIERSWQLYEYYSDERVRHKFQLKVADDKAARAAFIMLRINPELKRHEFDSYIQLLTDVPDSGDVRNKKQEYEKTKIRELRPLFGKLENKYYLNRNANNEPAKDAGPDIPEEDQWSPINTNSQNFVWLNRVANIFDLPGAVPEERVPFLQKIKEIRDAQPQEQEDKRTGRNWLDYAQMGLDVAGVFEPTPFSDSINAGISVLRAVAEPSNAGSHLVNAGISLASMIPYVGDFAKIYKGYGKGGSAMDALGRMKNNRSRWGRTASILYEAMGGRAIEHAGDQSRGANGLPGQASLASFGAGFTPSVNASAQASQAGGVGAFGATSAAALGASSQANGFGAIGGALAGLGGIGGGGGGAVAGGSGAGGGFGVPAALSGFAGALASVTAVAAGVVVAMRALHGWAEKTAKQGREMLESQRAGAMWSGQASSAMFAYDLSRLKREGQLGRYMAPATASLARSQDTLEQKLQDYNAPYLRLGANIQIAVNGIATGVIELMQSVDLIRMLLERIFPEFVQDIGFKNPIEMFHENPNKIPTKPGKFQFDIDNNNKKPRGFI